MTIPPDRWPQVLALAAHELRTQAGIVSGYGRMVLQDLAGDLPEEARALLEAADRSSVRLAGVLADLTELADLEAGTATPAASPVDLGPALAPLPDPSGPGPTVLPPVPEVRVRVDLPRFRRALASLAALHRRMGVSEPGVAARADARDVWLAVGEPGAARAAVAGVPHTARQALDDLHGGPGLGLVLALVIVDRLGGDIRTLAGSEPGLDVTIVRLPREPAG